MQLFKRTLLSLFPDQFFASNINPANMFISFISTKEFFSVINRKVVENYKLNLFDIALDPFEFKIGFGNKPSIKPKDIDLYYWYCCAANINWNRFLNPANIWNSLSLVTSVYIKDIFSKYDPNYFLYFLYSIYLLTFVFISRIKIFPSDDKQTNFNRLVEVIFSFYEFIFSQTGKTISRDELNKIKKEILSQSKVFFLLYTYYKKINDLFHSKDIWDKEFYWRIFYDEIRENKYKTLLESFVNEHEKYVHTTTFSGLETKILQLVLPADILIKYLFLESDVFLVVDTIISKLFDKGILDDLINQIIKDESKFEDLLLYITDFRNLKKNFFTGVQKYVINYFTEDYKDEISEEDVNELMSTIGDDTRNIDDIKIPDRIKKESRMMEKVLNFYVTFVWWFWISRWDNYFIRLFRRNIIERMVKMVDQTNYKNDTLYFYWSLLHSYGKNVFYYKYASDNVRAWKQKFYIPDKSDVKAIYSNLSILRLFDENFLTTLLQDINIKDVKLYIKTKNILNLFRNQFGKEISETIKKEKSDFINDIYWPIQENLKEITNFTKIISQNITEDDLYNLRDNIYNLDFWIAISFYKQVTSLNLNTSYSDFSIIGLFSIVRESLFGFLLYITYLESLEKTTKSSLESDVLYIVYVKDILNISWDYLYKVIELIKSIKSQFEEILQSWFTIDDNKQYFEIMKENRSLFTENKVKADILKTIIWEDIIRFRWFLKNVTYYNKRFLIPR